MALVLSSDDRAQLAATLEALLSPLASPTREGWYRRITPELRRLFRGDTTLIVSQVEGIARHFSAESPNLAAQLTAWSDFRRGEFHIRDPEIDEGLVLQRRRSMTVFTSALLDHLLGGGHYQRSAFYNDICVPNGARATLGLRVTGPDGETLLGVNCERPDFDLLSEDTLALLALVLPAFRAGLEILNRLEFARSSLAMTLDTLTDGMMVVSMAEGRELYRNHALIAMLADDPERDRLERRTLHLALSVRALVGSAVRPAPPLPPVVDEVTTAHAHYLLRVSYLVPGSFSREGAALVAIQAPSLTLPNVATLRARFRLTQREAEIALWLARGATDADLANTLGISQHTVRHHAENVFVKLGVHTRKALALHLVR
jgi:DNA-binding CsgD family transcriptional regulator